MKYLCLAYGDEKDWNELTKQQQDDLLRQDDVLRKRGDLVAAVEPSATTVRSWDGVPTTTDGGFAESRVPLAGFAIIDAPDLERAIELVADTPCARAKGAVELRPIDQINDHGDHPAEVLSHATPLTPEPAPELTDAHRQLDSFVGSWTIAGRNGEGAPVAPNAEVHGEQSFIWMPGRFFLMGNWDHRFENGRHLGVNIIRYDAVSGEYASYNVDNLGYARTYRVQRNENEWTFTGERERATMRFGEDGRTLAIDWEVTSDGSTWVSLCHLDATRS